ncbi:SGNH/GDSL hydrolase family protein [Sphingomonas sp.]|uniref:SGNH/GDSL hydrolase family protein n=1 Tax=Sphingomonas sp. TaxID=28214 RepID=UPI003B0054CC
MDIVAQDMAQQARSASAKALAAAGQTARVSRGLQPVGNNAALSTNASASTSTKYQSRMVLYCPKGADSISLVFGGVFSSTNSESDISVAAPMNLSYAVVPGPWDAAKSYVPGDQVSWYPVAATGNNPLYTCVTANTNSMPRPGNAAWAAAPAVAPIPITVEGQQLCGLTAQTTAGGTAVTKGWFQTDPFVPQGATGPCYVEIRAFVATAGTGNYALNYGQPFASGSYLNQGSSVADLTASGNGSVNAAPGSCLRPLLALGTPAIKDDARAVAIVSDSIGTGQMGYGLSGTYTFASGGSGYTSDDIGRVLTSPDTGATAGAVGAPARFVITNVASGAVTGIRMIHSGSYTNVASNPAQTLPGATQTLVGQTAGSGVQISGVSFVTGAMDGGDRGYAQGFLQRALSGAGMRWAGFTSPGDGICNWQARCYGRLAYLAKSGCTSAIIAIGINDVTGGKTAAQMQAAYLQLARQLKGVGFSGLYLTTMMPGTSSSDGFATLAGQTVAGYDAVRQSVNAWARGVPAPFDGCIDVAAAMEAGTTGKWVANGTPGYATIDGKHPTESGHLLAAAAVTQALPKLV